MKKKLTCVLCVMLCAMMLFSVSASASAMSEPVYNSYTYNYWGNEVFSPDAYVPEVSVRAENAGSDLALNEPSDIFVSDSNRIYVVDKKNNRIVVFNEQYQIEREIKEFKSGAEVLTLNQPMGIFVDENENMYIADYANHRAIKVNPDLEIVMEYLQPKSDIAFSGIDFLPMHIVVDEREFVYVHCQGLYQGAVTYDKTGKFISYFGGNAVEVGVNEVFKNIWRNIMTEEMIQNMDRSIPAEFTNLDINKNGFIFTCTKTSTKNNVVKVDPTGEDIMKDNQLIQSAYSTRYGDTKGKYYLSVMIQTAIVDVCYDEAGYINCLDSTAGRVFQYSDVTGDLICIFGGIGNQTGTTKTATAIDTLGDKIIILDSGKNHFTVFEPTDYVKSIKTALKQYEEGDFDNALTSWNEVLKQNSNLQLAYSGLGKTYYVMEDYKQAQKYFELGDDRSGYIKALEHNRKEAIDAGVPYALVAVIVLIVLSQARKIIKKLKNKKQQS